MLPDMVERCWFYSLTKLVNPSIVSYPYMDPAWDHTENQDKLLLTHASRMGNHTVTNDDSTDELRSVSGSGCSNNKLSTNYEIISLNIEYTNYLSSVVLNSVNTHAKHQLHDPFNIFSCYILFYSYIFLLTCKCSLFSSFLIMACLHRPVLTRFLKCSNQSNVIELLVVYYFLDNYKKGPLSVGNSRFFSKLIRRSSEFVLCCNAHLSIIESNLVITSLSEYLYRCIEILEILNIGTMCCCCVCCFKCKEKNGVKNETFNLSRTFINPHYYETAIMSFYNQGNHLCLCLIVNYLLANCIRLSICYLRDIEMDIISVIYKNYDKYTHSTTYMFSVSKLIMMIISIIYKITLWMKLKYLCTCPPGCQCCRRGSGRCTSGCEVCSQPPVLCCECPKKPPCNNGNSGNNCCCKCSQKNGQPCSSCCSGTCGENKCCMCCCNCFCKNYEDPYYPYLISIILYVSSLMENIWTIDHLSIVSAIESLSSLLAEYQSIHVFTNYFPSPDKILRIIIKGSIIGIGINNKSLVVTSNITSTIKLADQSTTTSIISTSCLGLLNDSSKSCFMCLRTLALGTHFSKDKFRLIYNKFSCLCYTSENCKSLLGLLNIRIIGISISKDYLDKLCKKPCEQTCCPKSGLSKICPIAKIRANCLSISLKRIEVVLSNVSGDVLLNYLMGSVNISEDFITNLCIGFGEVYTIMLKNLLINNDMVLRSYGNTGITNVETRNWGYDTKYEHDVSNDRGFRRGDWYPNILSDPRYTFSHLSLFLNNYRYMCMISTCNP